MDSTYMDSTYMDSTYKVRHRSRPTGPAHETHIQPCSSHADSASATLTGHATDDNYEVGYRKPPVHSRFVKGRSGNPRGRPKGAKNLKTDLIEELYEHILVREGDKAYRVTKQRAILKSLAAKAMKGDTRAIGLIATFVLRLMPPDDEAVDERGLSADDRAILENYEARIRNGALAVRRAKRSKESEP
jgi:hypothetical protein